MAESNNIDNLTDIENFEDNDEHKSYKLYNFRRPDKFSKDNFYVFSINIFVKI